MQVGSYNLGNIPNRNPLMDIGNTHDNPSCSPMRNHANNIGSSDYYNCGANPNLTGDVDMARATSNRSQFSSSGESNSQDANSNLKNYSANALQGSGSPMGHHQNLSNYSQGNRKSSFYTQQMKKKQIIHGKLSSQGGAPHPLSQTSQSKRDDNSYFRYPNNYNKENGNGDMEDDGEDFDEDEEDEEEEDNNEEFMDASDQYPQTSKLLNQPQSQFNKY